MCYAETPPIVFAALLFLTLSASADEGPDARAADGRRKVALSEVDASAAYRLAVEWAAQGRADLARRAYERVIAVAPDHLAARHALGFERVEGRWLAGDELKRARGFVRVAGRWVLAEEAPA